MKRKKNIVPGFILHLTLILLLIPLLYPLGMTMWGALKNQPDFANSQWYPTIPLYFTNLINAASKLKIYMGNTILVAFAGTTGMLFVASIAAYAFARMKFPGQKILYMFIISLMMVPGILTLVPSYMTYKKIVGLNNYTVLILPIIVGGSVFGVFLLRSFFEGIPEEIFEASRIDGSTEFVSYMKICLPLSIPILSTLAIMQISGVWNDYIWPMITIKDDHLFTISAALLINYVGSYSSNYPTLFAGYLVSSIPMIFLFIFANKYYIEGLTSSAMKL